MDPHLIEGVQSAGNPMVARVMDTRLEANELNEVTYVVQEGAQTVSYVPLTASSHSNLNTVFNLNNIADRTCRDSRLVISLPWSLAINVTNNSGGTIQLVNSDNFGFSYMPANRAMDSIQHQINQASYTIYISRMLDAIGRLNSFPNDRNFYENTQPDMTDKYDTGATPTAVGGLNGANLNPLSNYTTSIQGDGVFKPRSLNYQVFNNSIANGATQTVYITGVFYEPLCSPFNNISSKNARGLYAITGEVINIQYVQDLTKMFKFVNTSGNGSNVVINSVVPNLQTVNSSGQFVITKPTLNCIYLTPYENYFEEIPHESVYPYNSYEIFSNDIGAVSAGQTVSGITTQVVNMTNVPEKILIYAKLSENYLSNPAGTAMAIPDKYLTISNLSVQFDNGVPVLNQATNRQLYDISKRNGLVMPSPAFQQQQLNLGAYYGSYNGTSYQTAPVYGCGSVMVLSPFDLGLRPNVSAGSAGRYIMQATLSLTNNTNVSFPACTLYIVTITAGILERVGSQYRQYLATLPQDILQIAKQASPVTQDLYLSSKVDNAFLSGGGIKDFFRKAYDSVKDVGKFALEHVGDIEKAYDFAKKVRGKGKKTSRKRKVLTGGAQYHYNRDIHPPRNMELFYE